MTIRATQVPARLVDVARGLFARQGYAATSLDAVVAGAEVTKGALYHHFAGKQALFEAVLRTVEEAAADRVRAAVEVVEDPTERAIAGLREFLAVSRSEEYRRIVVLDAPAVRGPATPPAQEERSTFGIVSDIVTNLLRPSNVPQATVDALTRLFFGAMSTTGSAVSLAEDPEQASADAEAAIALVLEGLGALVRTHRAPNEEGDG